MADHCHMIVCFHVLLMDIVFCRSSLHCLLHFSRRGAIPVVFENNGGGTSLLCSAFCQVTSIRSSSRRMAVRLLRRVFSVLFRVAGLLEVLPNHLGTVPSFSVFLLTQLRKLPARSGSHRHWTLRSSLGGHAARSNFCCCIFGQSAPKFAHFPLPASSWQHHSTLLVFSGMLTGFT